MKKYFKKFYQNGALGLMYACAFLSSALAQEMAVSEPATPLIQEGQSQDQADFAEGGVSTEGQGQNLQNDHQKTESSLRVKINPNEIPSILFTYWEYTAIQEAKKSRGSFKDPDDVPIEDFEMEEENIQPGNRDIRLSGIVFKSSKDWTIWLNGQRITPVAVPKEIIDIKVYEEYIEVKWFDNYTKQILPIRLRPHQRFNIDSRIFLPG